MLWFIEARRIYSRRWVLEVVFKEGNGSLGIGHASPTLFVSENKMSYVQDSFSLQDGRIAYLHRPTLGWTVREYILALQSKFASSIVQPWVGRSRTTYSLIWRHTGSAEGLYLLVHSQSVIRLSRCRTARRNPLSHIVRKDCRVFSDLAR